jgi:hypothetical protein
VKVGEGERGEARADNRFGGRQTEFRGNAGVGDGHEPARLVSDAGDPDFAAGGGGAIADPAVANAELDSEAVFVSGLVGLFANDEAGRCLNAVSFTHHSTL